MATVDVDDPFGQPPLPRTFFERPVLEVGPALLGRTVVHASPHGLVAVRLTEVEAYDGENDPGSHAYRGPTRRNAVMFGPAGYAYVYFTYGMHWCMNLVCGPPGRAAAVLLRAGEVVAGSDLAGVRRPSARAHAELARGPARLTRALGVDGGLDGADTCAVTGALRVLAGQPVPPLSMRTGPRTGVVGGRESPWRFWVDGDASVSRYRSHSPRNPGSPARRLSGRLEERRIPRDTT